MTHAEKQLQSENRSSAKSLRIDSPDSVHEQHAKAAAESLSSNGQLMGSPGNLPGQLAAPPVANSGLIAPPELKGQLAEAKGGGDQLPDTFKRMTKAKPGELDDIRIHTDGKAAEFAEAVNAQAFTYGKDIYFGRGKFDTYSSEGKELIAHEVAHAKDNAKDGDSVVQRSAEIVKDEDAKKINVNAHLIFYGFEATDSVASACANEIQTMWNEPKPRVSMLGQTYDVMFNISNEVVSIDKAISMAGSNTSHKNNHIRVEKDNTDHRSKMGGNAGHFVTTDNLGKSTTAAHEFGHSLGLDHPDLKDWRGKGQPSIMVPRSPQYHVDPDYRYSNWQETKYEGINPYKRKVIKSDLENVKKMAIAGEGKHIGVVTNILFDAQGTPETESEALHVNAYGSVTKNNSDREASEKKKDKK